LLALRQIIPTLVLVFVCFVAWWCPLTFGLAGNHYKKYTLYPTLLFFRKPLKHCLLEIMTFHLPRLFVCLLDYLHACQRTFRDLKNDRFRIFSFCGTSPSSLRFCGTLVLSTWACTIPLRQHIPFILPFCFEPSFVLPPSDSDRQRWVLGIQSLVL
jgi:hypothetical protein